MSESVRPRTAVLAGLASFGLVLGGLTQCSEKCPDGCGPQVVVSWGSDVLPDGTHFVEVCVEMCADLQETDPSDSGSAAWVGVLPRRGPAEVTVTTYSGEGGGTALSQSTLETKVRERCGCRNLRVRVVDGGDELVLI